MLYHINRDAVQHCCNARRRAFTLIEMIVAITVFMIFLGYTFSSYQSVTRANRHAQIAHAKYRDVRHIFDTLARDIRSMTLDFDCLTTTDDLSCAELEHLNGKEKHILPLEDVEAKNRIIYKFRDGALFVLKQTRTSIREPWLPQPLPSSWAQVSSSALSITDMRFTVAPIKDPQLPQNAADSQIQIQPMVSIALEIPPMKIRTTYSSRTYGKNALYE